mgnify:CR=1 FL=1
MAGYDFDSPVERRGTNSIKWSHGEGGSDWVPNDNRAGAPHEESPLPMWLADMDFRAAPEILSALRERVAHGVFGYTHRSAEFDETVAGWAARRHGWQPPADSIIPGSGVMPAINLLIQTFTAPGDGVIVQPPVFHPIPEAAEYNDRRPVPSPLIEQDGRYSMDFADLAAKASDPNTKMWILCSPHNPVGRVWSRDELAAVVEICRDNDVLLVSDEIHADLTFSWARFWSVGSVAGDDFDQFVVCGGPSKAFNLPGLRFSTTIIPDPDLRARYEVALRNLNELWGTNILGATALVAAYTEGEAWLEALLAYLEGNLEYIQEYLAEKLPMLRLGKPDSLYLAWIDCRRLGLPGSELTQRLRDAGLWVENGATYGTAGEGFIRLTYATPRVLVKEALRRLESALAR